MPVNPKSLENLSPGIAKKERRSPIKPYVLPNTKASLERSPLKLGEAIDLAEFIRRNLMEFQSGKARAGLIRLVNPWRGRVWCAEIEVENGIVSARTGAEASKAFEKWDLYLCREGIEYYCGRSFSKRELMRWFSAEVLPADDQPQNDSLGSIPANTPEPTAWKWYGFTVGEVVLPRHLKPIAADLQKVAGYALAMRPDEFYPYLDCWEVWLCDKDSHEPVALVATGNTKEEAEQQQFSPLVRLGRGDLSYDFKEFEAARSLQTRINDRINSAVQPGRIGFVSRLFCRHLDGTAIEYRGGQEFGAAVLPEEWLAEPFWSEFKTLA